MTFNVRKSRFGLLAGLLAAAGTLTLAGQAQAQEAAEPIAVNNGSVSFGLGFDVVTQYFFRGYELEDSGFIMQPYVEAGTTLYEGEDAVNSIDLTIGSWNSWHSEETGAVGSGPSWWYESDIYAGLSFGLFDVLGVDVTYTGYFYPNGNFDDIHEISVGVSYDDSAYTEDMLGSALNPYIMFAFEVDNRNAGTDENAYMEIGVGPSWEIVQSADYPVTLSVPVAAGFSVDDYYADDNGDDEFFGFFSVGADVSTPLSAIPAEYGSWSAHAGVNLILKGDAALWDGSDDAAIWGSFGVAMEY